MKRILLRLRGVLGTAVAWGAAWFGAASLYFTVKTMGAAPVGMILFSSAGVGAAGFIAGTGFAVVLMVAERRHRVEELSPARCGVWGFLGSVAAGTPFLLELPLPSLAIALGLVGVLGAASSAGTIALARASDRPRELTEARQDWTPLPR